MKKKTSSKRKFHQGINPSLSGVSLKEAVLKCAPPAGSGTAASMAPGAAKNFMALPLSPATLTGLASQSFKRMTAIQRAAIPHALVGRDLLAAARTGQGKTLAFLVPVLERLYHLGVNTDDGMVAMIISPTRELALQIFEVLRNIGGSHQFSAGLVIGGKDFDGESAYISGMNIVIGTPGRLQHHLEHTPGFTADSIQILVLDEADRCLDLGFRAALDAIISYLPSSRQTMLFSATQTTSVTALARCSLVDPEYVAVHDPANDSAVTPPKLAQSYTIVSADQKLDVLYSFMTTHTSDKVLLFVASRKQVRFMYEIFRRIVPAASIAKPATTSNPQRGHRSGRHRQQHYTPGFYQLHGGMTQTQRLAVFNDFTKATHGVMFATDLAARGLDFTSVSWVIQVDCPDTPETYIHRVGRTARFRSAGRALLMLLPGETAMLDLLRSKRVELKRVKANPSQMRSDIVNGRLRSLLAQLPDLKYTAQAAFVSYCRTLHLAANKDVFRLENIDAGKLALSMGLVGTPKITFAGFGSGSRHDLKNMSMSLRDIVQGDKAKTGEDDKISRLLKRKNATIYHESRTRLRADNEDEEDDEEDFLTIGGRQDETTEKRQKKMNPSNADAIIDEDMIAEYGNQLKIVLAQADTECDKNADQLRVKQMHKASKRKLRQRRKIEYDHDESDDDEEGDDEEESVSDEDRVLGEEQMEAMARSVMNSRQ